jgi:hypothetical protein
MLMAHSNSVIHMTIGSPITVPMGLEDIRRALSDLDPHLPPFLRVEDVQGRTYLINANAIVDIEGKE